MRLALRCLAALALLVPVSVQADVSEDEAALRATLERWTDDFNAGRADRICDLFSTDLRYDYRGFEERGYADICALLKRSLADQKRTYSYAAPQVKEVLVSGDQAVVRLVWTLTVRPAGATALATSVEPGMDIFHRQPDGSWKIVRYIAYEE